jgi:hypothetical protein
MALREDGKGKDMWWYFRGVCVCAVNTLINIDTRAILHRFKPCGTRIYPPITKNGGRSLGASRGCLVPSRRQGNARLGAEMRLLLLLLLLLPCLGSAVTKCNF